MSTERSNGEWQPALTFNAHDMSNEEKIPSPTKIFVRPLGRVPLLPTQCIKEREEAGCDWQHVQFFAIEGRNEVVCEHEILTD